MTIELKGGDAYELSTDINVITAEINAYQRVAGEAIFEIGRRLHDVKNNPSRYGLPEGSDKEGKTIVARGAWGEFLASVNMEETYARKFEIIYVEINGNRATLHGKGMSALYEIAQIPTEQREKPHTIPSTGATKTVDEMTVRELREVKAELKKTREERDAERVEREQAEQAKTQAEQRERIAQRDADIAKQALEDAETVRYVEYPESETTDDRPYGVKLGDEIYAAFDELSDWQKRYSWLLTDRDEFKLLTEANPDFARQFQRLDKFWKQMSDAFHSVEMKGVYNSEAPEKPVTFEAEFTEIS